MLFPLAPLLLCLPAADSVPPNTLEARLTPLVKGHKGKVALAVKNLTTGEACYINADEVMPTASLIKVAVMIEVYQQAADGKLRLADTLTLRGNDRVPGSGVLTDCFSDGATFTVRDAVRLMMVVSDNTATNLVLDRVGLTAVNRRLADWGLPNTRIHHKVFRAETTSINPERSRRYGLGSTTAREMVRLFEEVQAGTHVRPAAKQIMLGHLRRNRDRDKFRRLLPADVDLPHKDGSLADTRTDAGLLYLPDAVVALCVLTTDNEDRRWSPDNAANLLCARVARAVHDHFHPPRPPQEPAP